MNKFTEQDKQIAEAILCKICKNLFKDPIQLPCSENVCDTVKNKMKSHLNDFIKVDKADHKSYFDCHFCNKQHPIVQGFEFSASKNLGSLCTFHKNNGYTELYNQCKQLLKKLIDIDQTFEIKHENDLSEYFSDLRSKVDLRRDEIILDVQNVSDELLKEINQIEKDYLEKLKRIYSVLDFEELKVKLRNYEDQLNKYKIDLDEWTQISEKMKKDLSKLNKIRKDSNKLVSTKEKVKFREASSNKDLIYLFGKLEKNLFVNGILISGCGDESIKIWDLESEECIKTINSHSEAVSCLELLENDQFASGSWDKTIKIWDSDTFECLKTLNGHSEGVRCIKKINQKEIMSGSEDLTIKFWEINSGDCLKTLQGHTKAVRSLEITNHKNIITSCSYDKDDLKL